ncbi:tail fiber domain-containing protein [Clostridium cibarium]|uniref:Tail fiber domain-containing protein n=1 Tax=Clostridium cibarium TaxID=2762247 RepID=A0ABR8PV53_9CLOT|nr:tail fiber domain-containing protein [Clostridium cibarium]MBD7912009.1 tail fiber domain-containing protein [Clostridium cibarium]
MAIKKGIYKYDTGVKDQNGNEIFDEIYFKTLGSLVEEDTSHRFSTDSEKAVWNGKADNVVVTQIANGLMSTADKKKLDGIQEGANLYLHPSSHSAAMIVQDTSHRFASDAEKTVWNNKANASHGNHVPAIQSASGKTFLRNDNTWQVVTPSNIGAIGTTGYQYINGDLEATNIHSNGTVTMKYVDQGGNSALGQILKNEDSFTMQNRKCKTAISLMDDGSFKTFSEDKSNYIVQGGGVNYLGYGNSDGKTYLHVGTDNGSFGIDWWSSDKKLKTNIENSEEIALDKIMKIKYYKFDWKDEPKAHVKLGVIAQQLQEIEDSWIMKVEQENGDENLQILANNMIPYITKGMQEQQKLINKLIEKNKEFEKRLEQLER